MLVSQFRGWGFSSRQNLTPDKQTGLGNWTEEQIVTRCGHSAAYFAVVITPFFFRDVI